MIEFEAFERKARERGLNKPQVPLHWFFVSYVDRAIGVFVGACFIQEEMWMKASDAAFKRHVLPTGIENATLEDVVQVPDNKLPAPEYRDRLLTLEEVRQIWPWVKA